MSIWRFVPAVRRPWNPAFRSTWNPAFRSTWEAMTHRERQWSFLIDAIIVVVAALALYAGHAAGNVLFP